MVYKYFFVKDTMQGLNIMPTDNTWEFFGMNRKIKIDVVLYTRIVDMPQVKLRNILKIMIYTTSIYTYGL